MHDDDFGGYHTFNAETLGAAIEFFKQKADVVETARLEYAPKSRSFLNILADTEKLQKPLGVLTRFVRGEMEGNELKLGMEIAANLKEFALGDPVLGHASCPRVITEIHGATDTYIASVQEIGDIKHTIHRSEEMRVLRHKYQKMIGNIPEGSVLEQSGEELAMIAKKKADSNRANAEDILQDGTHWVNFWLGTVDNMTPLCGTAIPTDLSDGEELGRQNTEHLSREDLPLLWLNQNYVYRVVDKLIAEAHAKAHKMRERGDFGIL